jgi:hypothetical protein
MISIKALSLLVLPLLAVATPTSAADCSTGPIECCDSVTKASDPSATAVLGLLGIVLDDLDVLVGLTCSPITVIGVGGGTWWVILLSDIVDVY